MSVIATSGLRKAYGATLALDGVNLNVSTGSLFGFLGPNGAGKTTLMRILMGLLRPSGGRASVFGLDAWRESTSVRARVGYLPGDVRLYGRMTGREFLRFCDQMRGGGAAAEVNRLLERFDIDVRRRIRNYSRGMKQKLGLIQAMMHKPELLVLDEPTTALDPLVQQTLYEELRAAALAGQTVLFSSHTLSEVELLCDRVAIVRKGRLVEDASIEDLRRRAVRRVEFSLKGRAPERLDFPAGFDPGPAPPGRFGGAWRGPMDRLLPWLAGLPVDDLVIDSPRLEDLFREYYIAGNDE